MAAAACEPAARVRVAPPRVLALLVAASGPAVAVGGLVAVNALAVGDPVVASGPAAMVAGVAEALHTVAETAMGLPRRQPAPQPLPSNPAARLRFLHRSLSKTWRNCSMSRSMKSFAT